jgi:transcriptional regulator GlxA family with amidase domain
MLGRMFASAVQHPASRRLSALLALQLHEPWSVPRLASALGLTSRTLYRVARRDLGVSPMSLLRRARLVRARAELDARLPGTTVTRVALDCGFTHLGRFSQEYVREFGERPSETLQRARGRQWTSARGMEVASQPHPTQPANEPSDRRVIWRVLVR